MSAEGSSDRPQFRSSIMVVKMDIKAIPTVYGGVKFRSRLEATWAAFFDRCGWSWDYEPVDLRGWAPDFALWFDAPVYVEVKPAPLAPLWSGGPAVLKSGADGFAKAKGKSAMWVLLLGLRPNDHADYFGIGTLLDNDQDTGWFRVNEFIAPADAAVKWAAAKNATQWVPA
jgi:hypothetical protein